MTARPGVALGAERRLTPAGAAVAFLFLSAALLSWAKWSPSWRHGLSVANGHPLGHSTLTGTSSHPPPISFSAATQFTWIYFKEIWPALVAGLSLAAALETFLPRGRIVRRLGGRRGAFAASLLAAPSMLCSCCAAPVTAWGAQTGSSRRGFVFVEQAAEEVAPPDLQRISGRWGRSIGSAGAIWRS